MLWSQKDFFFKVNDILFFFNIKQTCLSSWTTDLKHLKSINIHFKRFLNLSLLLSSPVSDLARRSTVYHEIKIKVGNLLVFPSEVQLASSRKAPAEQEFSFHCIVVVGGSRRWFVYW